MGDRRSRLNDLGANLDSPMLPASPGRGAAEDRCKGEDNRCREELAFRQAVAEGLADLDEGREASLVRAKTRLGLA